MREASTQRAMDHVRELSVSIGPRPSTGEGERRAAEYIERAMRRKGTETRTEAFQSIQSGWRPFAIASAMAVFSEAIFLFGSSGWWKLSLALTTTALTCAVLQLLFIPNPLMWLMSKGESQNVWTRVEPLTGTGQRLVITSHYDTHRTPLAYSSPAWIKIFRSLTTLGMGSFALLFGCYLAGLLLAEGSGWLRVVQAVSLVPAAVHVLVLGLTLQADTTPHTPGANDNATGVGTLLELAERFANRPAVGTEIWFVATGCEEVGLWGAAAFFEAHTRELDGAMQINIDNVGGKDCGPCFIDQEVMLATYRSDAKLLALADELVRERPELRAARKSYQGAYTDGAIGIKHGLPTITFLGLGPDGWIPNLHQMSDVIEHVDPDTVARTTDFVEALVRRIDERRPHPLG